jgi:hypothetical protein
MCSTTGARSRAGRPAGRGHEQRDDGSVTITLYDGSSLVVSATDDGVGGPPITNPGKVGIRGDSCDFNVDDFVVIGL